MPRIRSIKPEFWASTTLAQLTRESRLVFIGLWTFAEDNGVGVLNVRLLASSLFPMDEPVAAAEAIREAFLAFAELELVTCYQSHGKSVYHVTGWDEHQKIDRSRPGRFSLPEQDQIAESYALTRAFCLIDEPSRRSRRALAEPSLLEGKGREGNGRE